MIDDTDTDFCDRLPGQHTGRLSLQLQAIEAAEWQRRIDELEQQLANLKNELRMMKQLQSLHHPWCADDTCRLCNERAAGNP